VITNFDLISSSFCGTVSLLGFNFLSVRYPFSIFSHATGTVLHATVRLYFYFLLAFVQHKVESLMFHSSLQATVKTWLIFFCSLFLLMVASAQSGYLHMAGG
jgi:hypothetical protein